ncbi:hypothetical protein [Pseudogemmobacter sonorensis]|uniref:hypothetical protein n=1 Tax=Pseudogemmobacter sonorensis TaxID=2989681 RepID=UPI00367EF074
MLRILIACLAALFLSACGAERVWAPDERVAAARYVAGPPPSISLITVINDRSGAGAHSGLLINASQRVLFDPAGSWKHPDVPERNDLHYGITDQVLYFYRDYHARDTEAEKFHVVEQTLIVTPEIAETVMRLAMDYGAVPKAYCANSISNILSGVPGFEAISTTMFPKRLRADFATIPGVTEQIFTEENDNPGVGGHSVVLVDRQGNRVN